MQEQECQNESPKQEFRLRPYQDEAAQWAIDNGSGIIVAPAGSGKTWIAASIVKRFLAQREYYKIGWLAPTRETCHQAQASLEVAGVNMANVTIRCPHESVDFHNIDLLIVDECKHSPAESWKRIIENCDGLRFGFDATPWCDDPDRNNVTRSLFRNRIYEISRDDIGDSLADASLILSEATDYLIKDRIDAKIDKLFKERSRYMRMKAEEIRAMCAWEAITELGICENKARNQYAMQFAVNSDKQTLILVPRVTLGEWYEQQIPGSRLVHSKVGKKDRRAYMEEFKSYNLKTMIATSLADEGLDLPNVELLIMVSGGRSSQKTIQRASRALRKTSTKSTATIVDFMDRFHPIAESHAKKRIKCYKQLGCIFL
jgi:superfamily II DNA or RNA helicase